MTYLISTDYDPNEKVYRATFGGDYDYQVEAKTQKELNTKIKTEINN